MTVNRLCNSNKLYRTNQGCALRDLPAKYRPSLFGLGISLSKDINDRIRIVKKWARELGVTIFLKGYIDILSDGKELKLNKIHNEAMTVGGTGDVLAGIIGALAAKEIKPFNVIRIAAFLNGEAGNEAFDKKSYGLLATDIIEEIPTILKKYL